MIPTHQHVELKAVKVLPASLTQEIGRIVTRFSYLEQHLNHVVYKLIRIQPELGRIVVREPRLSDRMDMIKDILLAYNVKLPDYFQKLKNQFEKIQAERNLVAHGVWVKEPKSRKIFVIYTIGNTEVEIAFEKQKLKRRLLPSPLTLNAPECRQIRMRIIEASKKFNQFEDDFILPLLKTLPKYS